MATGTGPHNLAVPTGGGRHLDPDDPRPRRAVGWEGPVFKLSQDYPQSLPLPEDLPFLEIDFKKEPEAYLQSRPGLRPGWQPHPW